MPISAVVQGTRQSNSLAESGPLATSTHSTSTLSSSSALRQGQRAAGLADRITTHLLTSERLPLADATLDRITARNTIIYVRNPVATFEEFRRVLKPGGLAHAIESDWSLTAVEPLGSEWRALVGAASGSSLTLRALV